MARAFAHHVSTSWRIWNDLGGRNRDREEGALTCVSLVGQEELEALARVAGFEAQCAILAQKEIAGAGGGRGLSEHSADWYLLEFFRKAVQLSGEIYMAGDPTRSTVGGGTSWGI